MSLLDRFSQHPLYPENAGRAAAGRANNEAGLHRSICRNLEMLLNARRSMPESGLSVHPHSNKPAQSLYGYGLGDLSYCRQIQGLEDLCRDLETLIQQFEPRLTDVVVELNPENGQGNTLSFCIEAMVVGDGDNHCLFDTTINLTHRVMVVRDERHV